MSVYDDEIDRLLDALTAGREFGSNVIDSADMFAASRLFQTSRQVAPSRAFVAMLETALRSHAPVKEFANRQVTPISRPSSAHVDSRTTFGWIPRLACALSIVVLLVAGIAKVDGPGPAGETPAAALNAVSPAVYPAASDCVYDPAFRATVVADVARKGVPRLSETLLSITRSMPAHPGLLLPVLPESVLPSGTEVEPTTSVLILHAIRREIACRNAGVGAWPQVLAIAGMIATPQAGGGATPTTPSANGIVPIPIPEALRISNLPDGRVFALLSSDWYGYGLKMYFIFSPYGGYWATSDFGLTASDAWIASGYRGAAISNTIAINMEDTYIWPTELEIPANQPVALTVTNKDKRRHTLTIASLNQQISLEPGQQTSVTINPAARGYQFRFDVDPGSQSPDGGYIWAIDSQMSGLTATP